MIKKSNLISKMLGLLLLGCLVSELQAEQLYPVPTHEQLKAKLDHWLQGQEKLEPALKEKINQLWNSDKPVEPGLTLVLVSALQVEPDLRAQLALANEVVHPEHPGYQTLRKQLEETPDFIRQNVALYVATEFARNNYVDEAMGLFELIKPTEITDPATYYFFKAVCQQQLLQREAALESLKILLENTDGVPLRYRRVAELMQQQLEQMEEKSLDEIAHRMNDSERRLDLGRAGRRVQKVQEKIIKDLEELIKEKEDQQKSSSAAASGSGSNNPGSNPAEDSVIKGSKAPGEVDRKSFKKQGSWGDLPPKAEARARNLINRDFPSHYKQAIERYFKKLATRQAED